MSDKSEQKLQSILKYIFDKKSEDDCDNILEMHILQKNNYFLSEIIKCTVKTNLSVSNLIVKTPIQDKYNVEHYNVKIAFQNEKWAYTIILPNLEKYAPRKLSIPLCYGSYEDLIVLANLETEDYKPLNVLPITAIYSLLEELANLHSASLIMKAENPKLFMEISSKVKEILYKTNEENRVLSTQEFCIDIALKLFENNSDILQILYNIKGKTRQIIENLLKQHSNDQFKVINHGDLWLKNLLFYNTKVKLIDFQMMRFTSVAADLTYFFYVNLDPDFYKQHQDEFLSFYFQKLFVNVKDEKLTIIWLKREMKKWAIFGLIYGLWMLPLFYPKIEQINKDDYFEGKISCEQAINMMLPEEKDRFIRLVRFYIEQL